MYNKFRNLLCLLTVLSGFIFLQTNNFFGQTVDQKRNKAIELFNNGKVKKSITLLKQLANKENDTSSMLALGQIYLKYKEIDQAFYWINISGAKCNKSALVTLKTFYLTRSSTYFAPYKYNKIVKKCDFDNQSPKADKPPLKEDNRKKVKRVNHNNQNLIDERVTSSWGKIAKVEGKIAAHGSGFSILENGYFITNHHVIKGCDSIGVRYNHLYGKASLINFDENLDIALLKVEAPTPYYAKFNSDQYTAGEEVFVAGYPIPSIFGTEMSIRKGSITSPQVKNFGNRRGRILIDASIASGNSGGPVIDKFGSIRGVVTGGLSEKWIKKKFKEKGAIIGNSTFGLMISGNLVKIWLDDINIETHSVIVNASNRQSDIIGKVAKKFTAIIECYEK